MSSLEELKAEVKQFISERDWDQYNTPKDILLALFTEMGELAECYHWLSDEEVSQVHLDLNKKKNIEEEVADVFIYLLIFCHKTDIDLLKVFKEKMEKNKLKYPSDKMKGVHSNPLMGFKGK